MQNSPTSHNGIEETSEGEDAGKCTAGGGSIDTEVALGATGSRHVFANISSNAAGDGVQGWSLSIAVDGSVDITTVTTAGTVVDALFDGGFKKTEKIDPAKNAGQRGAVSAIVLSFTNPVFLPSTGTASVLDFDVAASGAQGDDPISGALSFKSGLKGAGQPVQNALTIGGATVDACNFGTAAVNVVFTKTSVRPNSRFIRGNANNDTKVNIADPIWIINELFRSGPKSTCQAASDANGDLAVDAADAVYLIDYQFRGGSQPPGPFPACDEAATDLCAETQDGCKA